MSGTILPTTGCTTDACWPAPPLAGRAAPWCPEAPRAAGACASHRRV